MNKATFLTSRINKACNDYLEAKQAEKQEIQERCIEKDMRNKVYIFWGRTFTRKEAIKRLEADSWNDYSFAGASCAWMSSDIKQLRTLCEKTKAVYIDVDSETIHRLRLYL